MDPGNEKLVLFQDDCRRQSWIFIMICLIHFSFEVLINIIHERLETKLLKNTTKKNTPHFFFVLFLKIQNDGRQSSWIWSQKWNLIAEMRSGCQKALKTMYYITLYDEKWLTLTYLEFFKMAAGGHLGFSNFHIFLVWDLQFTWLNSFKQ